MMRGLLSRKVAGMAAVLLVVTACSGAGNGVPSNASSFPAQSGALDENSKPVNLSGQYSGTVKDSVHGKGKASASLSRYKAALGGVLSVVGSSATADIAWTESGTTVAGTSVIVAPSGYCTFAMTSTYNATSFTLKGSYHAVHGCTGETGEYALKHKCVYESGSDEDVRPDNGPKGC
jgi:hypothetical protein